MRGLETLSDRPSLTAHSGSKTLVQKDSLNLSGRSSVTRTKKVLTVKELLQDKTDPIDGFEMSSHAQPVHRNPITGEGMPQRKQQCMYAANRRKDGNPLLGIGYGKNIRTSL